MATSLQAPILGSRPPRRTLRFLSFALFSALVLVVASFSSRKSESGSGLRSGSVEPEYAWTNQMLTWQRAGFHFRTVKNYMNDPSGPMYYKGWYHLFYQHNPNYAYWGDISWGHAVSRDLLNWFHLPVAVKPDRWYDIYGVWTGSITVMPDDGRVVMLYTGGTKEKYQIMSVAMAADPSDPLLVEWVKYDEVNPVLRPPPGIGLTDFRDPNPIWYNTTDSTWQLVIGSKNDSLQHTGIAMVYTTKDFINLTLLPGVLHSVDHVGMWECVDLFPVASSGPLIGRGLDRSMMLADNVKHVLKASMNDEWHDYYAIGSYDVATHRWVPDDESVDVGIGMRIDWGKFYASRTFYDPVKERRVMWGYVGETDSGDADVAKGWASFQGIPRTVLFDVKTGTNVLTWPIEEVESLRMTRKDFSDIVVNKGSTVELHVGDANQLDIEAEFEMDKDALETAIEADIGYNCSSSGGAVSRGVLGPFGLFVLANQDLTELTATYFYVSRATDGSLHTHLCHDEMRSSKANDIVKRVVGGTFTVLDGELLSLRILVDHSIVESFAQGGRTSATSRVYPTEAIYERARVFLFNNATGATITAKAVKVWQMNSTSNQYYPFTSSN
uniref:6(G)-fructosyltransferase n=1 Tax=Asparagus officinalis TaxID=4686 RepID=GFT_ASPOF|nr:RecName: Full=6(G)-fructosyltransferase; AltName: Full=6G-FFT; Short=6GFT; AltName: Full=6G-fructosyltransferase; AltName: Full=AoFT1 [Asparagus officinalis]BAD89564.1 6G-fructosyltransferase [Asparagus officinalis]